MRPDSSASSAARFVVSGLSVGAAGSDVFPRPSRVDSREVDVDVYSADHGTQQHQHEQYDQSDKHGNLLAAQTAALTLSRTSRGNSVC